MSLPRRARGFTLIEVMVALVIMAIMAVMAWQGVDGIVRARTFSQARLETTLRLDTVISQWDLDLASIQQTTAVSPSLTCNGASVRMVRKTTDGLQVVVWTLRPAQNGTSNWERWAGPSVTTVGELTESWIRSQQLQGSENNTLSTLAGINTWQVYFYREGDNNWSNCQSDQNVATSGNNGTTTLLPRGVRIVLSFAPGSGMNGDLTRDSLVLPP